MEITDYFFIGICVIVGVYFLKQTFFATKIIHEFNQQQLYEQTKAAIEAGPGIVIIYDDAARRITLSAAQGGE